MSRNVVSRMLAGSDATIDTISQFARCGMDVAPAAFYALSLQQHRKAVVSDLLPPGPLVDEKKCRNAWRL
jgi:hypothetical protein